MKMNKMIKGLLVGVLALQMVGCEEAKEVENINIQDTNPVVEEALTELCIENDKIATMLRTDVEAAAILTNPNYMKYFKNELTLGEKDALYAIHVVAFNKNPETYTREMFDEHVNTGVQLIALAKVHDNECARCDVLGDEANYVLKEECDTLFTKAALTLKDAKANMENKVANAICDNCNGRCVPYYSEDGITVCGEWCLQEMQNKIANEGLPYEAVCGKCGHHVRDVLYNENLGMEVCEDCWQ